MPTVVLLTVDPLPFPDPETPLLAAALRSIGIHPQIIGWSDPALLNVAAAAYVIRSTWDYHQQLPVFLDTLSGLPGLLLNPIPVVKWNCHKGYLVELAAKGIPVVPTVLIRHGAVESMPQLPFGADEVIIKPASSASAIGVGRFRLSDPAALHHLHQLAVLSDVLIQPFVDGITDGERSLIFFDGKFSHAVRKVPTAKDFRVQFEYGGQVHDHEPTHAELEVASAAIACAPGEVAYARVDVVQARTGPQVMELELIEPELFITRCPAAADRFAGVIASHLMKTL